jgi:cell division protease FtsH
MIKIILSVCLWGVVSGFSRLITKQVSNTCLYDMRKYPFSKKYFESHLKRLNSQNKTIQDAAILNDRYMDELHNETQKERSYNPFKNAMRRPRMPGIQIIISKRGGSDMSDGFDLEDGMFDLQSQFEDDYDLDLDLDDDDDDGGDGDREGDGLGGFFRTSKYPGEPHSRHASKSRSDETFEQFRRRFQSKSENFEVFTDYSTTFQDVGGYENIKQELNQCIDLLKNHTKYAKYNVRVPKGLILEGPPGNGKTLMAKAFSGEAGVGFIPVSGSQFQEKYVGVGSSRIRELFELAKKQRPCVIFIDEIDALGRKRSTDGETAGSERDSTLNELLVALDGFKNTTGIFLIGATNRVDLLDPALLRPGRIDKKIYIGNPDTKTRNAILSIHSKGKPREDTINIDDLVDLTAGLSGAEIENVLNEAMLNALREDRDLITQGDLDTVMNKLLVGWQPSEHQFTDDIIDHIAIHEMGHAIMGMMSKHHSKITKVVINLSAPNSPGYTVFETSVSNIYTREALFEHLMILLSGRIAEEVFYDVSVTTGAINDFEEALKLAEKMIMYYGLGKHVIYPVNSEKYKQMVDDEVHVLINDAYTYADFIVRNAKDFIYETAEILKKDKIIRVDELNKIIQNKYQHILDLKII